MKPDPQKGSLWLALLGIFLLNACAANGSAVRALPAGTGVAAARTLTARVATYVPPTLTLRPNDTPLSETLTPSGTPTRNYPLNFFASVTPYSPSPNPGGVICEDSAYVADVTFPDRS